MAMILYKEGEGRERGEGREWEGIGGEGGRREGRRWEGEGRQGEVGRGVFMMWSGGCGSYSEC